MTAQRTAAWLDERHLDRFHDHRRGHRALCMGPSAGGGGCFGCALALWATGILTLNQSLAGFGDPATIFVTSLFVASAALEKTGVTAWRARS